MFNSNMLKSVRNNLVSIKGRLIFSVTIVVFISVTLGNILSSYILADDYVNDIELKHIHLNKAVVSNVNGFIERAYSLSQLMSGVPDVKSFNQSNQSAIAVMSKTDNEFIELVYIQDKTGMQTARSQGKLGDRASRWWFQQIKSTNQAFVSKSYFSISGNMPVSSIIMPILDADGGFNGALGVDIKLDALQRIVEEFSTPTSYSFIVDGEGTVIAHPDESKVSELYNYIRMDKKTVKYGPQGKALKDDKGALLTKTEQVREAKKLANAVSLALDGQTGFMRYENIDGDPTYSSYGAIKLPGDSLPWAVITVEKVRDAELLKDRASVISNIAAVVSVLLTILVIFIVAGKVVHRIFEVSTSLKDLGKGQGDLTQRIPVARMDEVGTLGSLFNVFVEKLQSIVEEVKNNAGSLHKSGVSLAKANENISDSINKQANQLTNVAAATEQIDSSSKGVTESVATGMMILESTKKLVDSGNDQLQLVVDEMKLISGDVSTLAISIHELSDLSNSIGVILDSINVIASQTNLLALNAAIEAARAGEHGRGFSVVADEVRNLAEVTQKSVLEVEKIVHALQSGCNKAADDMKEASSRVVKGESLISCSSEQFKTIVLSFQELAEINEVIKKAIEEQGDALGGINENIHAISLEAETTASSIKDIANTVIVLQSDSDALWSSVNKFKV